MLFGFCEIADVMCDIPDSQLKSMEMEMEGDLSVVNVFQYVCFIGH